MRGGTYVIVRGFGGGESGRWLRSRQRQLESYRAQNLASNSNEIVTETLNVIGQTWIEALPPTDTSDPVARPARAGDDVSPIVITSNDLAAAWASDRNGNGLYPLVPGGARQRELSIRAGINLVMYTLTGNYKADQVHVRDLLERLAH